MTIDLNDPLTLIAIVGAAFALVLVILLIMVVKRAGQSTQMAQIVASQMGGVTQRVQMLSDGQQQLFGGLTSVTEAQAQSQANMLKLMEQRLQNVTEMMNRN